MLDATITIKCSDKLAINTILLMLQEEDEILDLINARLKRLGLPGVTVDDVFVDDDDIPEHIVNLISEDDDGLTREDDDD